MQALLFGNDPRESVFNVRPVTVRPVTVRPVKVRPDDAFGLLHRRAIGRQDAAMWNEIGINLRNATWKTGASGFWKRFQAGRRKAYSDKHWKMFLYYYLRTVPLSITRHHAPQAVS